MSGSISLVCRSCRAPLLRDQKFCEACGRGVVPPLAGCEHVEVDLGRAAGVSDRGLVRSRNEDALFVSAVAADEFVVVVCDGVGSTPDGDIAAQVAAEAAGHLLVDAVSGHRDEIADATIRAIAAARRAVAAATHVNTHDTAPPACTFVSAVWAANEITVGWVGDSRAYWIGDESARLLTTDDSWAEQQATAGSLSDEQIAADPRARSITRWLGADAPDAPPHIVAFRPDGAGRLVVCSDGLWGYMPVASSFAALLLSIAGRDGAPLAAARSLIDLALVAGGRDNATVAIVNVSISRRGA